MNYVSLKNILSLISQGNYVLALQKTIELHKTNGNDDHVKLLYLYLLTETERYEEAISKLEYIKNRPYDYFVKKIYVNLNMLDISKANETNNTDLFLYSLLCFEFQNAKKYCLEYYKQDPDHFLVALICYKIFNKDMNDKTFTDALKLHIKNNSNVLNGENFYLFVKNNMITSNWPDYIFNIVCKGTIIFLCLKMLLINNLITANNYKTLQRFLKKFFFECKQMINETKFDLFILQFTNFLLNNIDDWEIYKFCAKNSIQVTNKNTKNYSFFVLEQVFDVERFLNLLSTSCSMFEQEELVIKHADRLSKEIIENNFTLRYFLYDTKTIKVNDIMNYYENNKTINNLKLLFAVLISSKEEKNLLLALYIAEKEVSTYEHTYEIKLIALFLYRFFCVFDKVISIYKELDIKKNVLQNCAYVWSDLSIKYKFDSVKLKSEFFAQESSTHKGINTSLQIFIDKKSFYHSVELLICKKNLCENILSQELKKNTILCDNESSAFSNLLGTKSDFLFAKLTCSNSKTVFKNFTLRTIYTNDNADICENTDVVHDMYDCRAIEMYNKIQMYQLINMSTIR